MQMRQAPYMFTDKRGFLLYLSSCCEFPGHGTHSPHIPTWRIMKQANLLIFQMRSRSQNARVGEIQWNRKRAMYILKSELNFAMLYYSDPSCNTGRR